MASALGKHVIGFYPKIEECAPRRWGPFTNKAVIFTPEIDCDNCTRNQCENLNCMNSIDTGKVIRTVESIAVEIRERRAK
jgi:ADP-heptose:LPS heptosyltransferase